MAARVTRSRVSTPVVPPHGRTTRSAAAASGGGPSSPPPTGPSTSCSSEGEEEEEEDDEEATSDLERLRNSWCFPAVLHFARCFAPTLRLTVFSASDLEESLLSPSEHEAFLADLHTR